MMNKAFLWIMPATLTASMMLSGCVTVPAHGSRSWNTAPGYGEQSTRRLPGLQPPRPYSQHRYGDGRSGKSRHAQQAPPPQAKPLPARPPLKPDKRAKPKKQNDLALKPAPRPAKPLNKPAPAIKPKPHKETAPLALAPSKPPKKPPEQRNIPAQQPSTPPPVRKVPVSPRSDSGPPAEPSAPERRKEPEAAKPEEKQDRRITGADIPGISKRNAQEIIENPFSECSENPESFKCFLELSAPGILGKKIFEKLFSGKPIPVPETP